VGFTNPGESGANGQRLGLNRAVAVAGYLAKVLRSDSANTGVALTESYGGSVRVSKTGSAANRRVLVSLV
jgi:outer membrane protein OmpA-like peptidoglycan-associated protein